MKKIIQLEEMVLTIAAIYLLTWYNLGMGWWIWIGLFFTPDIGMLGYLVNTRIGAWVYNIFHHKGVAVVVASAGYYLGNDVLIAIGILLFAHASFDRAFGFGLKYNDSFKHTHVDNL